MRPEPQAVVRSTLPKAETERSALVRTLLPGAVRSEVRACSAGTRARAETPARHDVPPRRAEAKPAAGAAGEGRARRAPRRARRAAPSRGGHGGHFDITVEPRQERVVPATAVSAASRRASGARSERSERRREGYPPEGPRPRSGLGRVARSRSDAPNLIVGIPALVTIIGTPISITVCTTCIWITVTVVCTSGVCIDANTDSTRCALPSSTSRRGTALPERNCAGRRRECQRG